MKNIILLFLSMCVSSPIFGQQTNFSNPDYAPCSFENPSNTYENGLWSSTEGTRVVANDFIVPMNQAFNLNQIKVTFFTGPAESIDFANINYYEDANGLPGNVIESLLNIEPVNVDAGGIFGLKVWFITFDVTMFEFEAEPDFDTRYWISISMANSASSDAAYWETNSFDLYGLPSAVNDDGAGWEIYDSGTSQIYDGVYEFIGDCVLSINDTSLPKFVISPNPVADLLTIVVPNTETIQTIVLYDITGKQMDVPPHDTEIDVSMLPNGIYVLKITSGDKITIHKVLKK